MCDQQCCYFVTDSCQRTECLSNKHQRTTDTGDVFATHMCAVVGVDI